jgi:uncharacterized protein DUF3325
MVEAALVLAAYLSSYLGFALLALRQRPHHASVSASTRREKLPEALLRRHLALGGSALAVSFVLSWLAEGPSFGSILWVLLLAASALSVMFTLSLRPRWLRPILRGVSARG